MMSECRTAEELDGWAPVLRAAMRETECITPEALLTIQEIRDVALIAMVGATDAEVCVMRGLELGHTYHEIGEELARNGAARHPVPWDRVERIARVARERIRTAVRVAAVIHSARESGSASENAARCEATLPERVQMTRTA
jgi:hypothetical protein